MSTVAVILIDRVLDDGTAADVIVMLDVGDPKVVWARRVGMTLAADARLTGDTDRDRAINALTGVGFEVIVVTAHAHLGDDDRVTIQQWVRA